MGVVDGRVLDAFGLGGPQVPLPGGEGTSVRVDNAVLKPAGEDMEATNWTATAMDSIVEDGFRVARPLRTRDGAWSFDGWTASTYLPGAEPDHDNAPRWFEVLAAGRAFHQAIANLPCPAFLAHRLSPWETGNKMAWHETNVPLAPELLAPYALLSTCQGPTPPDRSQLIHGDLTGNVLFAPGLDPAVIDFSPYWRPAAFGLAIAVADAMLWHNAGVELLAQTTPTEGRTFVQHVCRATIFRLVITSEFARGTRPTPSAPPAAEVDRYLRVANLVATFIRPERTP